MEPFFKGQKDTPGSLRPWLPRLHFGFFVVVLFLFVFSSEVSGPAQGNSEGGHGHALQELLVPKPTRATKKTSGSFFVSS